MPNPPDDRSLSRRQTLTGLSLAGLAMAHAAPSAAQEDRMPATRTLTRHLTVMHLQADLQAEPGDWVETLGFYDGGDGGAALYQLRPASDELTVNGSDVIAMENSLRAVLQVSDAVNYRMFGAAGDGETDDGVAIKLCHEYANRTGVPVINRHGEYWIKQTNAIPIQTNVDWGSTTFHIDERFNSKSNPRWIVLNDAETKDLLADEALKQALLEQLRPGVQIIAALAPYAGHLISIQDANDRIGIRAGYEGNKGWAREELFYVEEEGRIIGDIAWQFQDLTSLKAIPCNDHFLVIQGGGFYYSGDTPEDNSPGYHQLGISIRRSRTIIRDQWMGLEPGRRDTSLEPRSGLYSLSSVYDVTLENIRAMPWEKNRQPPETPVKHGTYGLGGARMLNCTFRNITAEAGPVAWGVFGTNLNKNFRIENCRLNRVDVHFHCWNLTIVDSVIGFKGITVTGGGELIIDRSVHHGNSIIGFRTDYGAKWDGPILIRGCTLKPRSNGGVSVMVMHPRKFDYQYPIGFGTSVTIEDLKIDYAAAPDSNAECRLLSYPDFSADPTGRRLLFPQRITFRDIAVFGRERGVRLVSIPDPYQFDVRQEGGYADGRLQTNCLLVCERVQLERIVPDHPGDAGHVHLRLGGPEPRAYADGHALYPKLVFIDCQHVALYLGHCAASVALERCSANLVTAQELQGELRFSECRLQPAVAQADGPLYAVDSSLGTRFTNCTIHAPVIGGQSMPERLDDAGLLAVNGEVRHFHLNTSLGAEVMAYLDAHGTKLTPEFIAKLRAHHALEG